MAEGDDELLVGFFFAGFVEDTHVGLTAVEGFGGFAQAAGEAVVDEGEFEDSCDEIALVMWLPENVWCAPGRVR